MNTLWPAYPADDMSMTEGTANRPPPQTDLARAYLVVRLRDGDIVDQCPSWPAAVAARNRHEAAGMAHIVRRRERT